MQQNGIVHVGVLGILVISLFAIVYLGANTNGNGGKSAGAQNIASSYAAGQNAAADNQPVSGNRQAADNTTANAANGGQIVGNDRDAHGCIGSAGYSWCGAKGKCIRVWEEPCLAPGSLRILTEEFPPLNYKAADGTITGEATEVVLEIERRLNKSDTIEMKNWTDAYSVTLAQSDTVLYTTARTPERESSFKWVGPVASFDMVFYANSSSNLAVPNLSYAKMAKSVCAQSEDARAQYLLDNGFDNVDLQMNDAQCAQRVYLGQDDLWFGSSQVYNMTLQKAGLPSSSLRAVYVANKTDTYIAFNRQISDEVVKQWQDALDAMKADGTFDAIARRYSQGTNKSAGTS